MKKYAIIDIETTGGRASGDRITEIAIAVHDGTQIIERFESLINPERAIPGNITQITGITNEMVADAPKFFEVAKEVVEITQGCVFVAHNVRFDYGFIQEEFRRLGYQYTRRKLCTVRMSRKAFPGLPSYSLGKLIKHFDISVEARHRAMADVMATVEIFEKALQQQSGEATLNELVNLGIQESRLPPNITLDKLHALPEACGVYYFHGKDERIVYVGKSINIKKRIMQHFADLTPKGERLQQLAHDISFEITGSELVALLLENYEIKTLHPVINRAQRARPFRYGIYTYYDDDGYRCLNYTQLSTKARKEKYILKEFSNIRATKGAIKYLCETYDLCETHCHLNSSRPCFYFHLHKCQGACIGKESVAEYNEKVDMAIARLGLDSEDSFLIIDHGREEEERSVVLVEEGKYKGFGYVSLENGIEDVEVLRDAIKPYPHHQSIAKTIRYFVEEEKVIEVLNY